MYIFIYACWYLFRMQCKNASNIRPLIQLGLIFFFLLQGENETNSRKYSINEKTEGIEESLRNFKIYPITYNVFSISDINYIDQKKM